MSSTTCITYTTGKELIKLAIDKTKNTPINVNFPNELLGKVEDYQFENRIKNRTQAILELIKKGLEHKHDNS